MTKSRYELIKENLELMSNAVGEKYVILSLLGGEFKDMDLTYLGSVSDIDCEFKNDFFSDIYVDELGRIIDLRIFKSDPTKEEMGNMESYWIKLFKKYEKKVLPVFIIPDKLK